MINIPCKTTPPLTRASIGTLNSRHLPPFSRTTVSGLNRPGNGAAGTGGAGSPVRPAPAAPDARFQSGTVPVQSPAGGYGTPLPDIPVPPLRHPLRKGQKTSLNTGKGRPLRIRACFGWNIRDARCDVDASAFLVKADGRVPGDDWFVFYGQERSPDGSVVLSRDGRGGDRETITADLGRLSSEIQKIVFVVSIHEAFERKLNFSMLRDTYVRLLDADSGEELLSYCLEEYYQNVTSMTLGELYLHNGQWKFNPVGNGVNRDLAGQCAVYGVAIA